MPSHPRPNPQPLRTPLPGAPGARQFRRHRQESRLAFTPDVQVGDYVITHAGFAISRLDEAEARATLARFAALDALDPAAGQP